MCIRDSFQAATELFASGEGGRIVLVTQDIVSRQHQRLGRGHVLQGGQAQGGQACLLYTSRCV